MIWAAELLGEVLREALELRRRERCAAVRLRVRADDDRRAVLGTGEVARAIGEGRRIADAGR